MKDLDIMDLCALQALLIRYGNAIDRENTREITIIANALNVIMDDIAYRAEAFYESLL